MRINSTSGYQNQNQSANFKAGKYVTGDVDSMCKVMEKFRIKHCGNKSSYSVDNYFKPDFEFGFIKISENTVLIATEDTVHSARIILAEAAEQSGNLIENFKGKIAEKLGINFEPKDAKAMLEEMDNPSYDYPKMSIKQ